MRNVRVVLSCVRCGNIGAPTCEAPGWSNYRCSYSSFHRGMPVSSCPWQRERDGAWCRFPDGDGHELHEPHREPGEPTGGCQRFDSRPCPSLRTLSETCRVEEVGIPGASHARPCDKHPGGFCEVHGGVEDFQEHEDCRA